MSDPQSAPGPRATSPDHMRAIAGAVCGLEALTLLGFCVFYLWELSRGASADVTRAVMSTVLIAIFAVGLGLLARAWWRGADWPNTPTVVWNLLLLPVAWSLVQSGRGPLGALVAVIAVAGVVAAVLARTDAASGERPGTS